MPNPNIHRYQNKYRQVAKIVSFSVWGANSVAIQLGGGGGGVGGIFHITNYITLFKIWFRNNIFGGDQLAYNELLLVKSCYFLECSRLLNEYSVGPVLSFLAFERLIVVVFPFRAKQILNRWVYMGAAVSIPVFTVTATFGVLRDGNGDCGWEGL